MKAQHQAACWRRWRRKLPHNRVRRPRIRDEQRRVIGYGPATPLPEPELHPCFCGKVQMPSGRFEVILSGAAVAEAYRMARSPKRTPEEVVALPMTEEE